MKEKRERSHQINDEPLCAFDPIMNVPGDFHLLPHEWSFQISQKGTEGRLCESTDTSAFNSPLDLDQASAISIPTRIVQEVDEDLQKRVEIHKNMTRNNRWSHPLSTNDVSAYGNAYVQSMHCGPYDRTQLLVSR